MDCAYDSRDIFRYLESKNIIPVIKVRRNSVLDGSVRDKYVKMQLSDYDKWREKFGYGYNGLLRQCSQPSNAYSENMYQPKRWNTRL